MLCSFFKASDHNRVGGRGQAQELQKKPLCNLLPSLWFLGKIVLGFPGDLAFQFSMR
jgi:hypothetical protein